MAKTKSRQPSTHSRAARRAASPSLPTKDTATTTRSPSPTPGTLAPHASSGIIKRTKSKPLKRAQRLRQLKGMERAEENMDKLAAKVAASVGREKRVKERRKGWEEVNEEKRKKKGKKEVGGGNAFEMLGEGKEGGKREWGVDEDMDGAEVEIEGGEVQGGRVEASVPVATAAAAVEGEDELL